MSHHRDTQQSLLSQIATNTKNINVNVDTLEVNTDGLEALITTANNATHRDINNTNSIGDGSSNATAICLGYDRTGGKARSLLVDSAGRLEIQVLGNEAGDGSGNSKHLHLDNSGNVNANVVNSVNTEIHAHTDISDTNSAVRLLSDAQGHLQVDVIGGAFSASGLATETTLSAAEVHLGNVETKLGTIETNTTNSETHLGNIEGRLPTALDSGNLKVSIQSGNITGFATSALQGAGLPSALSSDNLKVSIQEGNITGFATATLQGGGLPSALSNDNLKVSIQEGNITGFATASNQSTTNTKLGTIETDIEATNTLLTTIDNVLDNAETHLGSIDTNIASVKTAVELLDNAVDSNALNVNMNIAGNDVDSNSGVKSANTQRVVIATDDVNVSQIASAQTLTTTQLHNGTSISGSGGSDTHSTLFTFTSNPRSITIFAADSSGSGSISGSQIAISPMVSMDNSTFFDLSTALASGGGSANQITKSEMLREAIVVIENCRFKFLKVKITNNAGGAINFDSFVCF